MVKTTQINSVYVNPSFFLDSIQNLFSPFPMSTTVESPALVPLLPPTQCHTPDHPPYAEMIRAAIAALSEASGSSLPSIDAYITLTYLDLPWGHQNLLPHYLKKLLAVGEIRETTPGRYSVSPGLLPDSPPVEEPVVVKRGRGRPRKGEIVIKRVKVGPKGKRGRPRKVKAEEDAVERPTKVRKPERIVTEVEMPVEAVAVETAEVVVKRRGRGRPRKIRMEQPGCQ